MHEKKKEMIGIVVAFMFLSLINLSHAITWYDTSRSYQQEITFEDLSNTTNRINEAIFLNLTHNGKARSDCRDVIIVNSTQTGNFSLLISNNDSISCMLGFQTNITKNTNGTMPFRFTILFQPHLNCIAGNS